MRPGSHASDDGSFGRSAGIQAGRAAALIGVAILIGLLLLHRVGVGAASPKVPTSTRLTVGSTANTGGTTANSTIPLSSTPTSSVALRAPQDIKVLVANGTGTAGLAGRVSNTLHSKGYATLASTNSAVKPAASIVYFQPSYSGDATALAAKLNLPGSAVQAMAQPPPVANLNGANILVVAGPNLATTASTTSTT